MRVSNTRVAAAALLSAVVEANLSGQEIDIATGKVVGYTAFNSTPAGLNGTNWAEVAVWYGIPFAASTAGNNRWRAPQPAPKLNATLYATEYGDVCPGATTNAEYTFSEDCLNLNIWSTANSSDAKLPVVMWSYPAESTARDDLFNGGGMAAQDVVFVNYNYRTDAFGWLSHPELSEEVFKATGHNSSGNWGMLDQFAAVKWIKANIENFGGDPDHITVMGQSAGSAATQHIVYSPLTKGDIVGAIIESGVRDPHDPLCTSLAEAYQTLEVSLAQGVKFLESLNLSSIAEARLAPFADLETAFMDSEWNFEATLDYYALPNTYLNILLEGAVNQVPILTGNTKDESGATYGLNITLAEYIADNEEYYNGTWNSTFFDLYPANDSLTASGAENSQWSDRSKIGTWFWSQYWASKSTQPVYNYYWDHAPPDQTRGAYHESEINYVLNNLYDTTSTPWEDVDYYIAHIMNSYWVNFIKTGDPNGAGLVYWPPTNTTPAVQVVGNEFKNAPPVDPAKVVLYSEWFKTLVAY